MPPLRYIGALHNYLSSFIRRTQPLLDIDSKQTAMVEEFDIKWDGGELEGWVDEGQKAPPDGSGEGIWCTACEYPTMMRRTHFTVSKAKNCIQSRRYTTPISPRKSTSKPPLGKPRQTNLLPTPMVPLLLRLLLPAMLQHRKISIAPPRC